MAMMTRANSPALALEPHAPWHTPVTYLYSGLAAMLGLIAFALLIRLAYSFCKLSGFLEGNEEEEARRDLEAQKAPPPPQVHEEKIFVVMAGQERPTFLATPKWPSMSSSFGDNINSSACTDSKTDNLVEMAEIVKHEFDQNP
ncbi:hypothetical protein RIF29_09712 [Crotalaria pallida]|uniref:Uncharacterized protein n=1 Tax=Crotalaria pallida TaxID=3830 RepID=A0AAN9ILN7_CROPI